MYFTGVLRFRDTELTVLELVNSKTIECILKTMQRPLSQILESFPSSHLVDDLELKLALSPTLDVG